MKISAGRLKGRKIGSHRLFKNMEGEAGLRPTSAKVREALFDILRDEITDATFLDLYAGSGTVGFEAISRGAGKCYFVENNRQRAAEIGAVIEKTSLGGTAVLLTEPVLGFLNRADKTGIRFDIIFSDPPYNSEEMSELIACVDRGTFLKNGGSLVLEHAAKRAPGNHEYRTLNLIKQYRYGDTMLTRYRKVL